MPITLLPRIVGFTINLFKMLSYSHVRFAFSSTRASSTSGGFILERNLDF
jgi:hypothetical protein